MLAIYRFTLGGLINRIVYSEKGVILQTLGRARYFEEPQKLDIIGLLKNPMVGVYTHTTYSHAHTYIWYTYIHIYLYIERKRERERERERERDVKGLLAPIFMYVFCAEY